MRDAHGRTERRWVEDPFYYESLNPDYADHQVDGRRFTASYGPINADLTWSPDAEDSPTGIWEVSIDLCRERLPVRAADAVQEAIGLANNYLDEVYAPQVVVWGDDG